MHFVFQKNCILNLNAGSKIIASCRCSLWTSVRTDDCSFVLYRIFRKNIFNKTQAMSILLLETCSPIQLKL